MSTYQNNFNISLSVISHDNVQLIAELISLKALIAKSTLQRKSNIFITFILDVINYIKFSSVKLPLSLVGYQKKPSLSREKTFLLIPNTELYRSVFFFIFNKIFFLRFPFP